MNINLTIADDHPVVLHGIQRMLQDAAHIRVFDICYNGGDLLLCLKKQQPDVLLIDIQMPGKNGDELAKIINEEYPRISILALTNMNQTFHVRNMLMSGALGYLLKSSDPHILLKAIETVYSGKQFIDPVMKEMMLEESIVVRNVDTPALTLREKEMLELIVNEYTSQEIAEKLCLSNRTIENYRLNLQFKLGVKNTAGLVRKAIQLGLVE